MALRAFRVAGSGFRVKYKQVQRFRELVIGDWLSPVKWAPVKQKTDEFNWASRDQGFVLVLFYCLQESVPVGAFVVFAVFPCFVYFSSISHSI